MWNLVCDLSGIKIKQQRLSSLSRTRISTKSAYIEKGNFATRIYPFNFLSNFRKVVVRLLCTTWLQKSLHYFISFYEYCVVAPFHRDKCAVCALKERG